MNSPRIPASEPEPIPPDRTFLLALARTRMPFGRYKGRLLVDLPEAYIIWFKTRGYPPGKLGQMLAAMYEIKRNGLEYLIRQLDANDNE